MEKARATRYHFLLRNIQKTIREILETESDQWGLAIDGTYNVFVTWLEPEQVEAKGFTFVGCYNRDSSLWDMWEDCKHASDVADAKGMRAVLA